LAAREAFLATLGDYSAGRTDLSAVLTCLGQVLRQQQALVRLVGLYNRDIAEYAMTVAPPSIGPQELLGMLIRPSRQPLRPLVSDNIPRSAETPSATSGVEPAAFEEAVPTPAVRPSEQTPTPAVRPDEQTPTPAPREMPPVAEPPAEPGAELTQPDDSGWMPSGSTGASPTPADVPLELPPLPPLERLEEPDKAPEDEPKEVSQPASPVMELPKPALVPVEPEEIEPLKPIPTTVRKPVTVEEVPSAAVAATTVPALYGGLADATPARRAKQLALALHWDRSLPEGVGSPISLQECLSRVSASQREATVVAYWEARRLAAEYQAVVTQAELIDDLFATAKPDNARDRSRLHSAKQTTTAARHEAHAALLEGLYELARRIDRASDTRWPMPSTTPHSGPYLLRLDERPRELAQTWQMKRLAATIPTLGKGLQDRAAAVTDADAARAAAAAKFATGDRDLEVVLASISRQTEETFAFLDSLSEYNRAIVEYALTVLPTATPAEQVVATLVVQ
jgi:hypothetical protein